MHDSKTNVSMGELCSINKTLLARQPLLNKSSGAGQMGLDGLNLIFISFRPIGVRLVPLKTHDFKGSRPDFNRF